MRGPDKSKAALVGAEGLWDYCDSKKQRQNRKKILYLQRAFTVIEVGETQVRDHRNILKGFSGLSAVRFVDHINLWGTTKRCSGGQRMWLEGHVCLPDFIVINILKSATSLLVALVPVDNSEIRNRRDRRRI